MCDEVSHESVDIFIHHNIQVAWLNFINCLVHIYMYGRGPLVVLDTSTSIIGYNEFVSYDRYIYASQNLSVRMDID